MLAAAGSLGRLLTRGSPQSPPDAPRAATEHIETIRTAVQFALRDELVRSPVIGDSAVLIDYLTATQASERVEVFRVLYLDSGNFLISDEEVYRGSLSKTVADPREVIRRALEIDAVGAILVHNHPSGRTAPSAEDIRTTREIVAAAKLFRITIHDHVIIGKGSFSSLRALGYL